MRYPKAVRDWCDQQTVCAACWCQLAPAWPPSAVHHLIRRGRQHHVWNVLALCHGCHDGGIHGLGKQPTITLGMQLALKLESDPTNWEPDKLEELYGRRLPHLMPLPSEYQAERERNRPFAMSY